MSNPYEWDWPSIPGEFEELIIEPAPTPPVMTEAEADELLVECAELDARHAQLTAGI